VAGVSDECDVAVYPGGKGTVDPELLFADFAVRYETQHPVDYGTEVSKGFEHDRLVTFCCVCSGRRSCEVLVRLGGGEVIYLLA